MELLANDPYAFTSDKKLMEDLRTCLKSIAFNLSADAYAKLKTVTFSEFQNDGTTRQVLFLVPETARNPSPGKYPEENILKKVRKVLVRKEILSISTR